jgi:hypothetical protein
MISDWALYFALAGTAAFIAVILYANRRPKTLAFSFLAAAIPPLLALPIVNLYKIQVINFGFQEYVLPYAGYTIPLILVSAAFFLLGSLMLLHKKNRNLPNNPTTGSNPKKAGFFLAVLSPMSLIAAAIVYAPMGPIPVSSTVPGTPLREYTLGLIIASAALLALGTALSFYKKPNRFGFLWAASGSAILFAASFAHAYRTHITELVFGYVPVSRDINPIREYALPLFLVGTSLSALGYALMLQKNKRQSTQCHGNLLIS